MSSFLSTLLIVLGSFIVIVGVLWLLVYLHGRTYSDLYDEMKKKLTPPQFDVWLKIQNIQSEISRMEREFTSGNSHNTFTGRRYIYARYELQELRDEEAELWEKFYGLGG